MAQAPVERQDEEFQRLLQQIGELKTRVRRFEILRENVCDEIDEIGVHRTTETRALFWMEYALRMLRVDNTPQSRSYRRGILTEMNTRVDWAYGIGLLVGGANKESEALYHGSVHSYPFWSKPIPPIHSATDRDFLALVRRACVDLTSQRTIHRDQCLTLFNLFYNTAAERTRALPLFNIDIITRRLAALGGEVNPDAPDIAKLGPERGARVVYVRGNLFQIHGIRDGQTLDTIAVEAADSPNHIAQEGMTQAVRDDLETLRLRVPPVEGPRTANQTAALQRPLNNLIMNPDGQVVADNATITIDSNVYLLVPLNFRDISCIIQFLIVYGSSMITDEYSVSTLKVVATVPVLLNGVPSEGSSRAEKHFVNIAQTFGISEGVARGAASGCRVAGETLMALLSPPGAAKAMMAAMVRMSDRYGCRWLEILAYRMFGYCFTPLIIIQTAIRTFPVAPWSLFFSRREFGFNDVVDVDNLNLKRPYSVWLPFVREMVNRGILDRTVQDGWGGFTEEVRGDHLLAAHKALMTKDLDCPELRLQGKAFLEDYARWLNDPLIMYTRVEGMSNRYPDLAYFSVALVKKHLPGNQIAGYKGATIDRCKQPRFMLEVLDRFSDYLSSVTTSLVTADRQLGPTLVALFATPEVMTVNEIQAIRGIFDAPGEQNVAQNINAAIHQIQPAVINYAGHVGNDAPVDEPVDEEDVIIAAGPPQVADEAQSDNEANMDDVE